MFSFCFYRYFKSSNTYLNFRIENEKELNILFRYRKLVVKWNFVNFQALHLPSSFEAFYTEANIHFQNP